MISFKKGKAIEVIEESDSISWIKVEIEGKIENAVNYNRLTGRVSLGDDLLLNTTAVELSLGTGGQHFVISNENNQTQQLSGKGHIMKLRYTPMQLKCLAAEEEDSPYHEEIKSFQSLESSKFIVCTLHSMIAPIAAYIKALKPEMNVNYIMTDGGALPIDFSKTVTELKRKDIINSTITAGQAFGGDYEAVNIYTSLIIAKEVVKSDITIISMGPGIVGTNTKYGFSGIEQGYISDAVTNLGGTSIAVPRISFSDKRERHKGISHHSITIFKEIMNKKSNLVFPILETEKDGFLKEQIEKNELSKAHNLVFEKGNFIKEAMDEFDLKVKTMGRGYFEDTEFFKTLGAAANYSLNLEEN